MNKLFTKEIKIALVAIVGIVVLFAGMNFLKGILVLSDDSSYIVKVQNLDGLTASSPIYADGYKVGIVRSIDYDYQGAQGGIMVHIDCDKNLRIPLGTTAEIVSDLMGNVKMNLLMANNPRERLEPGGMISGMPSEGVMTKVAALVPYLEQMMPKLDSILTNVNALLADPALKGTLHNMEAISANLNTSSQELNTLMAEMNRNVPGLLTKADHVMTNTEKLTGNLSQVDVAGTMAEIDATLKNVHELTAKLNSQEGTVGKFLNDPSFYNNMNKTMTDVDSLMLDLRAHPKRYVHFSLFGKKDK